MSTMSKVLVVGQLPPPLNGMTLTTETILRSDLSSRVELLRLDTSDHRGIENVGRFDTRNVKLALGHALAFAARLFRHRPDLVYLPLARNRVGFLRDCLFLVPARLARRTVLVHFHSWSFFDFYEREAAWVRVLARCGLGPRVHAVVLSPNLRSAFGPLVSDEHVHVVPNGVPDVGAGEPAGARPPTVLYLSTLWSEKGLFEALEVARVVTSSSQARFVIAGPWYSEQERRRAESFVREHALEDAVAFVGPVAGERKGALLREAAVLLLPSRYEGQPLVVLEALAAGTPIVASDIGALAETIDHGVEGFLVAAGDVDAFARRTLELVRDPALRSRMGARARQRYESSFTDRQFAARLSDLLVSLASGGREQRVERRSQVPAESRR